MERHLAAARRSAQVLLARHPLMYARLLRAVRRGSVEKRAFLRLLRSGDVAIDVGANAGYFTLLFSDIVGASGHVHAFEPVAPTFDRLSRSISGGRRFDNVTLNRAACSDADGVTTMMVPGQDWGQASLVNHHHDSWASAATITRYETSLVRLDRYLEATRTGHVDFVKLDAEGAELGALKGLARTLATQRPILSVELYARWTRDFGYEPADLIEFVETLGYDALLALDDETGPVTADAAAAMASARSVNLVFGVRDAHAARFGGLH